MLFLTFLVGLAVNFAGYVPFGNVNLTVVQLTINRSIKDAMYFIVTFSVIEFFFTYGVMYFADYFASKKSLIYWMDWILILVFFVFSFRSWNNSRKEKYINYTHRESIKYAILLGFLNPMQIPFWLIIGTYVISHQWILVGNGALALFSIGSCFGAFLCLLAYARFSKYLHEKFSFSSKVVNRSISVVFLALGIIHLTKMLFFQ
ncbi:MAG: lysine transporter LysE [Daejeonella sp.]